jgi:hypothetical protein
MWFAYADESYNDDFHWVIALLIEHTMINEGHRAMRDVMLRIEDAFPTIDADDVELHGYDIFHGLGAFQALEPRARVWIFNAAMVVPRARNVRLSS